MMGYGLYRMNQPDKNGPTTTIILTQGGAGRSAPPPVGTGPGGASSNSGNESSGQASSTTACAPTALSAKRYRLVPPGGNRFDLQRKAKHLTPKCWIKKTSGGTDLFGRLWWDRPSVTIRTEFFKPEQGRYLHPSKHRPITHREAARLMGFPDEFVFQGTKVEIARQIGNAVPPPLAKAIAATIRQLLSGRQTRRKAA